MIKAKGVVQLSFGTDEAMLTFRSPKALRPEFDEVEQTSKERVTGREALKGRATRPVLRALRVTK